jgi:uncharacterized protein (DUF697 family)
MKKMMMTLAAVLCCVMTMALFTACEKDKDEFKYAITVQPGGILTGANAVAWTNAVLNTYQAELGIDSNEFTKHGEQEQCDKEVFEACNRAEQKLGKALSTVARGSGEVTVNNLTARKRIYGKTIQ